MDFREMVIYDTKLTKKDSDNIINYLDLKWGWKEKILCWLFPRQYPELVRVKQFRKGLYCWIDASDASTITKDGSDFVSQIDDKSGNGNHLVSTSKNTKQT